MVTDVYSSRGCGCAFESECRSTQSSDATGRELGVGEGHCVHRKKLECGIDSIYVSFRVCEWRKVTFSFSIVDRRDTRTWLSLRAQNGSTVI